jgi:hypothetical protein
VSDETHFEWAIEVPARGWIGYNGFSLTPSFTGFTKIEDAKIVLEDWKRRYAAQGFPEIPSTLLIVTRKSTLTKTRWVPEIESGTP